MPFDMHSEFRQSNERHEYALSGCAFNLLQRCDFHNEVVVKSQIIIGPSLAVHLSTSGGEAALAAGNQNHSFQVSIGKPWPVVSIAL
jgi:hypothetical protein